MSSLDYDYITHDMVKCLSDVLYNYTMSCRCSSHPFQCDESSEGGGEVVGCGI